MKKILLLITSMFALNVFSQTCPVNMDFEQGNYTGWTLTSGNINNINLPCDTCASHPGGVAVTVNTNSTISGICTNGIDNLTGLPIVAPGGGNYSILLNDASLGGKIEKISKTFIVNSSDTNLIVQYQVILQDGGHSYNNQPYFHTYIYDSTNASIISSTFDSLSISNPTIAWQTSSINGADYMPWKTVVLNLSSVIGHTVTLEFIVSGCSSGGHFGYAYIDANCGATLKSCGGLATASLCFVNTNNNLQNEIYFNHNTTSLHGIGTVIYRKNTSNTWDSIGYVPASQPDEFTDLTAIPNQQAYTYCVASSDSCHNISSKTTAHTTILLQSNLGTTGQVNLTWNAYVGVSTNTYYIYRGALPAAMTLLAQVPFSNLAYTDLNPLSGSNYYKVAIKAPTNCTSNASHDTLIASNYRANTVTEISYINAPDLFNIYPNPTNGTINVYSFEIAKSIEIIDILGNTISIITPINNIETINLQNFNKGIYFIKTINSRGVFCKKFLLE